MEGSQCWGLVSQVLGVGQEMAMHEAPNTSRSVTSEPYPVLTERLPRWCKATESLKHRSKNTLNFNGGVKPEVPEGSCQTCLQALGLEKDLPGLLQL